MTKPHIMHGTQHARPGHHKRRQQHPQPACWPACRQPLRLTLLGSQRDSTSRTATSCPLYVSSTWGGGRGEQHQKQARLKGLKGRPRTSSGAKNAGKQMPARLFRRLHDADPTSCSCPPGPWLDGVVGCVHHHRQAKQQAGGQPGEGRGRSGQGRRGLSEQQASVESLQ